MRSLADARRHRLEATPQFWRTVRAIVAGAEPARFRRSVAQLHANMLGGFGDWCAAVDLPERVPEVEHAALSRTSGTPVWPAAQTCQNHDFSRNKMVEQNCVRYWHHPGLKCYEMLAVRPLPEKTLASNS